MNVSSDDMLLYVVTDRQWLNGRLLKEQLHDAIKAGATFVQLREKEMDLKQFVEEAKNIKELTDQYHIPFVINDNIEVMLECQADGVHVGQSDMGAKEVRRLIGEDKILGVSVENVMQAIEAEKDGANYIGVGAMFSTGTKRDAVDVPYEVLQAICQAVSIPVVAIGGINSENLLELSGSGIDGVAVISAVFSKANVFEAAKEMRILSQKMIGKPSGKLPKVIEGAIFDLDGTLIDSMGMWDAAPGEYLQTKGIDSAGNIREEIKTWSLSDVANYFRMEYHLKESVDQIIHEINGSIEERYRNSIPLKPGVKSFLHRLGEKGVRMCIATATDHHLVEMALKRLDIYKYFDFIITGREVGIGKEDPKIFLNALKRLGTLRGRTVVFEDAFHAIKAASNAGFHVIALADSYENADKKEIQGIVDVYLESFEDVKAAEMNE